MQTSLYFIIFAKEQNRDNFQCCYCVVFQTLHLDANCAQSTVPPSGDQHITHTGACRKVVENDEVSLHYTCNTHYTTNVCGNQHIIHKGAGGKAVENDEVSRKLYTHNTQFTVPVCRNQHITHTGWWKGFGK